MSIVKPHKYLSRHTMMNGSDERRPRIDADQNSLLVNKTWPDAVVTDGPCRLNRTFPCVHTLTP